MQTDLPLSLAIGRPPSRSLRKPRPADAELSHIAPLMLVQSDVGARGRGGSRLPSRPDAQKSFGEPVIESRSEQTVSRDVIESTAQLDRERGQLVLSTGSAGGLLRGVFRDSFGGRSGVPPRPHTDTTAQTTVAKPTRGACQVCPIAGLFFDCIQRCLVRLFGRLPFDAFRISPAYLTCSAGSSFGRHDLSAGIEDLGGNGSAS